MNPHCKNMVENKHILVGNNSYRLTILKYINDYTAYLSDVNSQFSVSRRFRKNELNPNTLEKWIVDSNYMNDPEARFFEHLNEWDGVIAVE
ncbi:hypothetical protein AB4Y30_11600 [Ornithinibacillus sp. 4-3]|uniref:Transposase n=1 Tax=Ornithinibacillus sp. 4-3 TaxID=3231488 RepID=A0AB39HNR4_9BACI